MGKKEFRSKVPPIADIIAPPTNPTHTARRHSPSPLPRPSITWYVNGERMHTHHQEAVAMLDTEAYDRIQKGYPGYIACTWDTCKEYLAETADSVDFDHTKFLCLIAVSSVTGTNELQIVPHDVNDPSVSVRQGDVVVLPAIGIPPDLFDPHRQPEQDDWATIDRSDPNVSAILWQSYWERVDSL